MAVDAVTDWMNVFQVYRDGSGGQASSFTGKMVICRRTRRTCYMIAWTPRHTWEGYDFTIVRGGGAAACEFELLSIGGFGLRAAAQSPHIVCLFYSTPIQSHDMKDDDIAYIENLIIFVQPLR